ncbi:similar to Saccharomyces cerevisiae YFR014C CMK1 Calmodulin-dependent protein kinase [Maudiozyma saulgeensis]|uniref:calcium/calmodulin-dependent protein kinase n=1 Tax=Maudiozyma saulgeensis TaxID=1789683 RepID=A0A1X7R0Q9_9SACH|nr:similar to Saccharomyces cerevisiae YFR014C CMK1 Calmodulin-dependent protein kinase [Kazachstania saulgeensis]
MSEDLDKSVDNKSDYIFGKTLGAGTFGIVRQARKLSTNEDVAVKILLKKALKGNDVQLKMLYDELEILQKLDHPNIVHFKDWFETLEKFFIVTQLATGGELFDRILKKGKFTEQDAVDILVQILKAVEYIHSKNIIHRDLKPENLLYVNSSDKSPLVIADFGIAKELNTGDELVFKAAGSLGYVAPEVLTTDGHGKPCDIWSIGVITYTLLCGYSPFVAESVEGFLDECTSSDQPITFHKPYWDTISSKAKNFILRALTLDPEGRPTATELLQDPWIICTEWEENNLLPGVRRGFDARKKLREAIEIVKLNNRINKLKNMYCTDDESDLEENSVNSSSSSLASSFKNMSIKSEQSGQELTEQQKLLKAAITRDTFAQLVKAATQNKERILKYDEESQASREGSDVSSQVDDN